MRDTLTCEDAGNFTLHDRWTRAHRSVAGNFSDRERFLVHGNDIADRLAAKRRGMHDDDPAFLQVQRDVGKATGVAYALGKLVGRRVVLLGCSTGGSLAVWLAAQPWVKNELAALILFVCCQASTIGSRPPSIIDITPRHPPRVAPKTSDAFID